jgi:YVTN family beta-propeller protein
MKKLNLALVLLLGIWLIPPAVLAEVNLTQIGTIAVSGGWMALTPDGSKLYVNSGKNLSVVDTETKTVVATIPLLVNSSMMGIAITPDGRYVYLLFDQRYSGSNRVDVVDTSTNSIITTIPINNVSRWGPRGIAFTPDGKEAYVNILSPEKVVVISTATYTVVGSISLVGADGPSEIAITPDGSRAYVSNRDNSTVSVIDIVTRTLMTTIPVSLEPYGGGTSLTITPDGKKVYITHPRFGSIAVIDSNPASSSFNQEIGTISTTSTDLGKITITPDGKMLLVISRSTPDEILVIDADPSSPTFHTQIGRVEKIEAYDVVVSPNSSVAYVSGGETISVIGIERVGNSTDDCWATYENGNLHIPCIKVKGPSGEEWHYEGDMQYEPLSDPMTFQVTGVKPK